MRFAHTLRKIKTVRYVRCSINAFDVVRAFGVVALPLSRLEAFYRCTVADSRLSPDFLYFPTRLENLKSKTNEH